MRSAVYLCSHAAHSVKACCRVLSCTDQCGTAKSGAYHAGEGEAETRFDPVYNFLNRAAAAADWGLPEEGPVAGNQHLSTLLSRVP